MKAVKKLTMKGAGLDANICTKLIEKFDKEIPVCRILGQITGSKAKVSRVNEEPYTEFFGEFQAQNLANGDQIRSRGLILPAVAEMPLVDHISAIEEGESATFVIDVTILPTHTVNPNMSKYQWGVSIKTDVSELDFLTKLASTVEPPQFLDVPEGLLEIEDKTPAASAPSEEEIEKAEKSTKAKKK